MELNYRFGVKDLHEVQQGQWVQQVLAHQGGPKGAQNDNKYSLLEISTLNNNLVGQNNTINIGSKI